MTNKEKVIKELKEVLDSLDVTNKYRLNLIRAIEYLQEEPKFKVGDTIRYLEDGNMRTIIEVREDNYKLDDCSILHFNAQGNWELVEKPVKCSSYKNPQDCEIYPDCSDCMGNISEEPVSENLEKASKEWLAPQLDSSYAAYGERAMMELTNFDGYAMLDAIEFGAKWQQEKDEEEKVLTYKHGFEDCKEQMMAKAIDAKIGSFTNGTIYDADFNIDSNLKDNSKVKVIVIKED